MSGPNEKGLGDEERAGLARLHDDLRPAARIEERIVGRLLKRGLVRGPLFRYPSRNQVALAVVASLVLLLVGFQSARWFLPTRDAFQTPDSTYLLLLSGGRPIETTDDLDLRVQAMRDWVAALRKEGIRIDGERLKPGGWRVDRRASISTDLDGVDASALPGPLSGFFLIQGPDIEGVLSIARRCPHLAHEGSIQVRRIAIREPSGSSSSRD